MMNNKYFAKALAQIERKKDRNTGGLLLMRKMVHKSQKDYDRRKLKIQDKRGFE